MLGQRQRVCQPLHHRFVLSLFYTPFHPHLLCPHHFGGRGGGCVTLSLFLHILCPHHFGGGVVLHCPLFYTPFHPHLLCPYHFLGRAYRFNLVICLSVSVSYACPSVANNFCHMFLEKQKCVRSVKLSMNTCQHVNQGTVS